MTHVTNPKDKIGVTKHPMSILPSTAIRWGALAAKHGADKYGPYNWRDYPIHTSVYVDAMLRHLYAYWDGEDVDPESGLNHLCHILAGCSILADAIEHDMVKDDRPSKAKSKEG